MTPAEDVLSAAKHKYKLATEAWAAQFDIGGIVPLDRSIPEDSDEASKGRKYKTTSPTAVMVLSVWQKCKAELDAAAANVQRERGDVGCPTCKPDDQSRGVVPAPSDQHDSRLPVEREDVEAPL